MVIDGLEEGSVKVKFRMVQPEPPPLETKASGREKPSKGDKKAHLAKSPDLLLKNLGEASETGGLSIAGGPSKALKDETPQEMKELHEKRQTVIAKKADKAAAKKAKAKEDKKAARKDEKKAAKRTPSEMPRSHGTRPMVNRPPTPMPRSRACRRKSRSGKCQSGLSRPRSGARRRKSQPKKK